MPAPFVDTLDIGRQAEWSLSALGLTSILMTLVESVPRDGLYGEGQFRLRGQQLAYLESIFKG